MSNLDQPTVPEGQFCDVRRAREVGTIRQALHVALGAATLIDEKELIERLKPIARWYRDKTNSEIEGTPCV